MSAWMPREDLETLVGVKPIESSFNASSRRMLYRHNEKYAELTDLQGDYSKWLDREAECCRKAFVT